MGLVHTGFYEALSSVWDQLMMRLEEHGARRKSLWITGHSLGGALGTLVAATFGLQLVNMGFNGVYTFGQPRIGNVEFAKNFNHRLGAKAFRFVNKNDIVTRIPP